MTNISRYYPTIKPNNYPSDTQSNQFDTNMVKSFKSLSSFYLNLNHYSETKRENNFLVFERNLDTSSSTDNSNSSGMSDSLTISSLSIENDPIALNSTSDNDKMHPKSDHHQFFLSHYYQDLPIIIDAQLNFFINQLSSYMNKKNESLAHLQGFSFTNKNGQLFPIIFTERPINGPLSSLFERKPPTTDQEPDEDKQSKITAENKYQLLIKIAEGIAFIHKNNFIHTNLNPTTVYLNKYNEPLICDYVFFPFYQVHTEKNKNKYFITAETSMKLFQKKNVYVAPEILNGGEIGPQSDIYSLGMMIYYILSEKDPKRTDCDFKCPPDFPSNWKEIIEKCTRRNASERMSINELVNTLLAEDKFEQLIVSMAPKVVKFEISERTNMSILSIRRSISSGFDSQVEFDIESRMIPNINEIEDEIKIIIKLAENGHTKSIEKIGDFFHTGQHNFYRDDTFALGCYQHASSSKNSLSSTIKAAEFYEKGFGTDINLNESYDLYQKALTFLDKNDPERNKIEEKVAKIHHKRRLLKLKNVSLNKSEKVLRFQFNNIESIEFQKNEDNQDVLILFKDVSDLKNAENGINKMKTDKYEYETYYHVSIKTNRFDSLVKDLPRLNLNDFHLKSTNKVISVGGSYAQTFKVYKKDETEVFAAKVFKERLPDNDVNKFKREVILSSKLRNYPTIVQYVGFNEYSLVDYLQGKKTIEIKPTLFMKYVNQGDLEIAIHQKPPEWWNDTRKVKIIIGVAHALFVMSKHQIIHRDLKPANILLNDNFEPVVCDLGSSRQYTNENQQKYTKNVGTQTYMAPEVYDYHINPIYNNKIDSYSFGIIAYQVITLKKNIYPEDFNPYDIMTKKFSIDDIPKDVDDIDDGVLKEIIKSCWNGSVDARPLPPAIYEQLVDHIYQSDPLLKNANIEEVKDYIMRINVPEQQ